MPLYEFQCRSCGTRFERLLSMAQAGDRPSCPQCASQEVERVLSLFGTKSGGEFRSSSGGGCSGCTGHSCGSCH